MNFWQRRKVGKQVKHLLHAARHARHMRGDVAAVEDLARLVDAEQRLATAWAARDTAAVAAASEALNAAINQVMPLRQPAWIRENLEVLVVAAAVAMAVRTYFIQPFKIPTGSMQPTLYGITVQPQAGRGVMDYFPLNVVSFLLWGERYVEVRAPASGLFELGVTQSEDDAAVLVNGAVTRMPINFCRKRSASLLEPRAEFFAVQPGEPVARGQRIASGRIKLGDHIFVDKIRYNFFPPKRGQIIVFDTKTLKYPDVRTDSFYIKRLVALPGETVALKPPHLVIDGKDIEQPYPFWRMLYDEQFLQTRWDLYRALQPVGHDLPERAPELARGYIMPGAMAFLSSPGEGRKLADDEFLPMGDNTFSSLDGRYFGPLRMTELVGPAFMVYWPITKRWGLAR